MKVGVSPALAEDSPALMEDGAAAIGSEAEADIVTVSSGAFEDLAVPTNEGVAETGKALSPIPEAVTQTVADVSATAPPAQCTPEPVDAVTDAVEKKPSDAMPGQQQQQTPEASGEHARTLIAISDAVVDNVAGSEKTRRPSSPSYFRKISATKVRRYTSRQISVVTPDLEVSRSMLDSLQV
jgi:hypothetical protein